jgi:hypothetical protein
VADDDDQSSGAQRLHALLLSPAAPPSAAKLDVASRPQNAASAATVRLDRIAIVRLH